MQVIQVQFFLLYDRGYVYLMHSKHKKENEFNIWFMSTSYNKHVLRIIDISKDARNLDSANMTSFGETSIKIRRVSKWHDQMREKNHLSRIFDQTVKLIRQLILKESNTMPK